MGRATIVYVILVAADVPARTGAKLVNGLVKVPKS